MKEGRYREISLVLIYLCKVWLRLFLRLNTKIYPTRSWRLVTQSSVFGCSARSVGSVSRAPRSPRAPCSVCSVGGALRSPRASSRQYSVRVLACSHKYAPAPIILSAFVMPKAAKSNRTDRRKSLFKKIHDEGIEMRPCSQYVCDGKGRIAHRDSRRCADCHEKNVSCDLVVSSSNWACIDKQPFVVSAIQACRDRIMERQQKMNTVLREIIRL